MRIYRYVVPINGRWNTIDMCPSPILHIEKRQSAFMSVEFWAFHSEQAPMVSRMFRAVSTGEELDGAQPMRWRGTCHSTNTHNTWHLLELLTDVQTENGQDPYSLWQEQA